MFKTNLKSKLMAAVLVTIGITALQSCEKSDNGDKPSAMMKITNSEICKMHNEVIGSVKNLKQLKSDSIQSMDLFFENCLPLIESALLQNDPDRYSNSLSLEEYREVLNRIDVLNSSSSNSEFLTYTSAFIQDLKDRGEVSDYFYTELMEMTENATIFTNDQMIQYLDSDFALNISELESNLKDLVVLMAKSSDELWNDSKLLKRPGSSTIIADAIGALWGLPLGGVGSIIYGAAFSLYENEILQD